MEALGYTAYKTTTKPTSLGNFKKVMCVRKGTSDYHFMKGVSLTNWRHKPGTTQPLHWLYNNPGYKNWTNENWVYDVYHTGTTTYTSTIYYIVYWLSNLGDNIEEEI